MVVLDLSRPLRGFVVCEVALQRVVDDTPLRGVPAVWRGTEYDLTAESVLSVGSAVAREPPAA